MKIKQNQNGFTLLEMLVTMSIISLVMVAIVTVSKPDTKNTTAYSLAFKIRLQFSDAQSRAMRQGKIQVVSFFPHQREIINHYGESYIIPENLRLDITAEASNLLGQDVVQVRFLPNGQSSGAEISISDGNEAYDLRLEWLTATISLEKYVQN